MANDLRYVKIHPLTATEAVLALEGRHPTDSELRAYSDVIMDGEHISNASTMRLITAVLDLREALRIACEWRADALITRGCSCEDNDEWAGGIGYEFTCGLHHEPYRTRVFERLTRWLAHRAIVQARP